MMKALLCALLLPTLLPVSAAEEATPPSVPAPGNSSPITPFSGDPTPVTPSPDASSPGASTSDSLPSAAAYKECRAGNPAALRAYVGAPVILVSEYATELVPCEGAAGFHGLMVVVHHCRVVASDNPAFPLGKAVIYKEIPEPSPSALPPPKGRLLWLISPSALHTRNLTGEIELCESVIPLPLEATPEAYERARRAYKARE